jgi:hypothetical protein
MPIFIIRTAQRQTAYNEYRVDAPTRDIAQGRVKAGTESGNTYDTDYDTELIESCEEERDDES